MGFQLHGMLKREYYKDSKIGSGHQEWARESRHNKGGLEGIILYDT